MILIKFYVLGLQFCSTAFYAQLWLKLLFLRYVKVELKNNSFVLTFVAAVSLRLSVLAGNYAEFYFVVCTASQVLFI